LRQVCTFKCRSLEMDVNKGRVLCAVCGWFWFWSNESTWKRLNTPPNQQTAACDPRILGFFAALQHMLELHCGSVHLIASNVQVSPHFKSRVNQDTCRGTLLLGHLSITELIEWRSKTLSSSGKRLYADSSMPQYQASTAFMLITATGPVSLACQPR
jgi:hypothetical protein